MTLGIRMSAEAEARGSDEMEHNVVEKTGKAFGSKKMSIIAVHSAPVENGVLENGVETAHQNGVAETTAA